MTLLMSLFSDFLASSSTNMMLWVKTTMSVSKFFRCFFFFLLDSNALLSCCWSWRTWSWSCGPSCYSCGHLSWLDWPPCPPSWSCPWTPWWWRRAWLALHLRDFILFGMTSMALQFKLVWQSMHVTLKRLI